LAAPQNRGCSVCFGDRRLSEGLNFTDLRFDAPVPEFCLDKEDRTKVKVSVRNYSSQAKVGGKNMLRLSGSME
jgi:hypothetical protein